MGMSCRCCRHPERAALDAELALGKPLRLLSKRFGVTIHSLSRHRKGGHIPQHVLDVMRQARELRDVDVEALRRQVGDGVVFALSRRKAALEALFEAEVKAERAFNAAALAKEARSHDEALARICGEIAPRVHQHLHVLASQEWGRIRAAILRRVRERPELRGELLALLTEVEGERPHLDGSPLPRGPLIEAAAHAG